MSTYIISYDLCGPESSSDYQKLIAGIQGLGAWAKPLESFWILSTNSSSTQIVDYLKGFLDPNDKILVAEISTKNWASLGLDNRVINWMHTNI